MNDPREQAEAIVQLVEDGLATPEEIRETWENWKALNPEQSPMSYRIGPSNETLVRLAIQTIPENVERLEPGQVLTVERRPDEDDGQVFIVTLGEAG